MRAGKMAQLYYSRKIANKRMLHQRVYLVMNMIAYLKLKSVSFQPNLLPCTGETFFSNRAVCLPLL